jgi:predicted TIM-barrel fold metal-dependent hydrolase
MVLKFGLISADSHAGFDRDDFTKRMSAAKWGDKIPHVAYAPPRDRDTEGGPTPFGGHEGGEGWSVYGKPPAQLANCPALMPKNPVVSPKRWDEVPRGYYDPAERLKRLDEDGVDAEVLFPNPPGNTFFSFGDVEFELDAVRAYNDALGAWNQFSDRYWPLMTLPWLQEVPGMVAELERAVSVGHKGINMPGHTPSGLPPIFNPHWDPIWDACQQLDIPVHFHGSAGIHAGMKLKQWDGYSRRQGHSAFTSTSAVTPAQIVPNMIFAGVTDRFPRLKVVFAEAGIGGLNYVISACDYEWEKRRLWEEGLTTRPSETVRRQMFVNFWFEDEGIKLRHDIGIDNIMWESDFPHITAYYPDSWKAVDRVLEGVSEADRTKLLYENALRVYGVNATVKTPVTA